MPSTDEEEEPTENADADKEKREKKDQEVSRLQPGEKKKNLTQFRAHIKMQHCGLYRQVGIRTSSTTLYIYICIVNILLIFSKQVSKW